MRAYDIIWKKREGFELTYEEMDYLISGYLRGDVLDYQISAWCMAVFFKGMTFAESVAITQIMATSGESIDLTGIPGIKVDKHSTGGIGDKTSLVVLPLVAACGVPIAKMSGRGLGHTGGTIDKLESIPGFVTSLTQSDFLTQVQQLGIAVAGQTAHLAPADKKLYALRDTTATIESIPLIASSIMSKKLASGADAIVLDVKYGSGAFMEDYESAYKLGENMVEIGKRSGKRCAAIFSDMNQPLGRAIGNSLEVKEAIQTLQGDGPPDLVQLVTVLGGYMVWLGGKAETAETGQEMIIQVLRNGQGMRKFIQWIGAQHGDIAAIENPALLPTSKHIYKIKANDVGWIQKTDCRLLGLLAMKLGAGRNKMDDVIRPETGLIVNVKNGDRVNHDTVIAEIHASSEADWVWASEEIKQSFIISQREVRRNELIKDVLA